ncbi:MAG: hypothetical protein EHM70_11895 [Chloroflexota bacterium]|nr:MAG: hypothetical protein EHM70_11895 [Chloroflexota bacterium]
MPDMVPTSQFEEEIRAAVVTPPAREEFVKSLQAHLIQQAASQRKVNRPILRRPGWVVVSVMVVLVIAILWIGPQRVMAAMRSLMGYLPGVGIVDQSAPIRVLAEPVTVTRDEISITVTSVTLTGDKTHLEYRIVGVPGSAYPDREDVMGCTTQEYLRLPDGTQLARIDNDFEPVPAGIDMATFIMPCIFNTLPGKTPENWELPMRFVPAPPNMTVMPVIEVSPLPQPSLTPEAATLSDTMSATPTAMVDSRITIIKEIETSDGYILVGQFPFQGPPGEQVHNGEAEIRDANGEKVAFTSPQDIDPKALGLDPNGPYWFMQFKAAGLAYPLTIRFSGFAIQQADPNATAEFTFDAGSNPQPRQEWSPNQDIQLAGHTLRLLAIMAESRNGYRFSFQGDPKVISADVQIDGYTPTGHGWGRGLNAGGFDVNISFAQFPTGVLTVTLSNLTVAGETLTWQGQWSPDTIRTDLPANLTPQPGLCLTVDSLAHLQPAPAYFANSKALFYEKLAETGTWGLALYNLDGSGRQVVTANGNWGALSPEGNTVVYSAQDNGIHLVDVNSQTDQVLQNAFGFDIHWSPDGTQIAYIGMGNGTINSAFIAKVDGSQVRQISDWSYETIISWSPDGTQLYFAVPFTGGTAWKVYSYEVASGTAQERFTIENGTPKFLNPKLSPDGNWIAYRGRDNSSLYLVRTDGSDMHLLLDNAGVVGVEWSRSGWLGVSLRQANSDESMIVLIKPDGCEVYMLPIALHGDLEGLFIP